MFECFHHILVYEILKLNSQTDKISFTCPCHLPKIFGKKAKATTKVTLYEPPIITPFL